MNRTAYAVGHLDTSTAPPYLINVEIYSADARGVTTHRPDTFLFNIWSVTGEDFGDAVLKLVDALKLRWPWAYALYEATHSATPEHPSELVARAPGYDDTDDTDK